MAIRSVRLRIEGRVQGVGFRAWTRREASALGLAGSVRNLADGSVEAVLEGEAASVAAMIALCRSGPRHAGVSTVEVSECDPRGLTGFEVMRGW